MREVDFIVMGHVFAAHRKLGRLCDESVYQCELLQQLLSAGLDAAIEVPVTLSHRQFRTRLELDLVVDESVIYELKTVETLASRHEAQLLGYLFLTNSTRGKLVNFRSPSVESRFVNTTIDDADRHGYALDVRGFSGDDRLLALIRELIQDWGTGLDASLYRRAILHSLSDELEPERMLTMLSDKRPIGKQRFHLLDCETALSVTTFSSGVNGAYFRDFQKLLAASPLTELHWLNVSREEVSLCTVTNNRKI